MLLTRCVLVHLPSPVLVLWDIDGTLITHAPALRDRHARAASFVVGEQLEKVSSGLGKTDRQILIEIMGSIGFSPSPSMVASAMAELDSITIKDLSEEPSISLAGVREVLEMLQIRGANQVLLTGNTPARAEIKVLSSGLGEFFNFAQGFYGDVANNRFELTKQAQEIWGASDGRFVVVGDTPLDIKAAHHANMRIAAVATGLHSMEELEAEHPDLLIRNYVEDGRQIDEFISRLSIDIVT